MNNYKLLNHIAVALVAALLSLTGCNKQSVQLPPPATTNDLKQADITILHRGQPEGKGILVGSRTSNKDRVFFLTARHVVTYQDMSETDLIFKLGSGTQWPIRTTKNRWRTMDKKFDCAWFELTDAEKDVILGKEHIKYIPLSDLTGTPSGGMMSGTGTLNLRKTVVGKGGEQPEVMAIYRFGTDTGRMDTRAIFPIELPFPHNQKLKSCTNEIAIILTDNPCDCGDSGGPAFIKRSIQGKDYWLLSGILLGGSRNPKTNAVLPIEDIQKAILGRSLQLSDNPDFW